MKKFLTFAAIFSLPFLMGAGTVVKTLGGNVATKTASYVVTNADGLSYIKASGSGTIITLPAPGSNIGRQITVERSDAPNSQCIGFASNSDTVDGTQYQPSGTSSFCLATNKDKVTFVAFAANAWQIASSRRATTQQKFTTGSGTYTTPAGVAYIRVRMVGGGGGGGGSGTMTGTAGGNGGSTSFGTLIAGGGAGGGVNGSYTGPGGSVTVGSGFSGVVSMPGATGGGGQRNDNAYVNGAVGGSPGVSPFGGAGGASGGTGSQDGRDAQANSGSGGGGAASYATNTYPGGGGAAGGYIEATATPTGGQTYAYSVGSGGSMGIGGGSNVKAGGPGGSGVIIVDEYYQ